MTDDALFNALAGAASIVEVALGTVSADEAAPDLETNLRTTAGRLVTACQLLSPSLRPSTHTTTGGTR